MTSGPHLVWNVDPVLLPDWGLRWFTLWYWLELALGYWLLRRQVRRAGGDEEDAADLAVYLWIGFVVGARLGHVVFYDLDHVIADPAWTLKIWTGGLGSHGAVLGVAVAARIFAQRRGMSWLEICDRITFTAALFAVVHRIANWFNSEVVGLPTDGSWGVRFPRFGMNEVGPWRHPSQLYEVALGVVLFVALVLCDRRADATRPRGLLTGVGLVTYFVGRFAVEFFKDPQGPVSLGLDTGQWLSLPFIATGAWLCWRVFDQRVEAGWRMPEPLR